MIGKVAGIDLGTTNSVISVFEAGKPVVVPNEYGTRTTASIVAYTKKQELIVGQLAKRQNVMNPESTFFSVKRFIGRKASEVTEELKQLPYKITEDEKGNIKLKCPNFNTEFSPEEISAQILRKLVNDASTYMKQSIKEAVITVPAYFNDSQRQATKDAGKIAGLDVLRIINEPTAASLAYGLDKNVNQTILVFDLGGGTFDVSILEVGDGVFEVLSTSGDTSLGGDDFDKVIVNWVINDFKEKEKIDLASDLQALQRINEACEKAKIELSNALETVISLPFITADESGPKHIHTVLTQTKFEELASNLISRCRIPVENALNDAGLKKEQLNEIVLVGGSTRIVAIQKLVKEITNKKINQSINPDEVVAIGAAIQGGILAGEVRDILLLDVTPLSLGLETLGGIMTKVIARNTTIPVKKSEMFSTATDNQTNVEIHVLQGERELASNNKSLGRFRLDGIPPAQRSVPQIRVTFNIDGDGILSVKAKETTTNTQQSITIQGASTLDKDEVEKMLSQAEAFAKVDKEKRKNIELQNQAELMCYDIEMLIERYTLSPEIKQQAPKIIEKIRSAIVANNFDSLAKKLQDLEAIKAQITTIIYSKNDPNK